MSKTWMMVTLAGLAAATVGGVWLAGEPAVAPETAAPAPDEANASTRSEGIAHAAVTADSQEAPSFARVIAARVAAQAAQARDQAQDREREEVTSASSGFGNPAPETLQALQEQQRQRRERMAQGFEQMMQAGELDPEREATLHQRLQDAMGALALPDGIELLDTECTVELCRVRVGFEDPERQDQLSGNLAAMKLVTGHAVFVHRVGDGETQVYLGADGELPLERALQLGS